MSCCSFVKYVLNPAATIAVLVLSDVYRFIVWLHEFPLPHSPGSAFHCIQDAPWFVLISGWSPGAHQSGLHRSDTGELANPALGSVLLTSLWYLQRLYNYQPNLLDAQLLNAWLTVMDAAHDRLPEDACLDLLPKFFSGCVDCLLADKSFVKETVASVMEVSKNALPPSLYFPSLSYPSLPPSSLSSLLSSPLPPLSYPSLPPSPPLPPLPSLLSLLSFLSLILPLLSPLPPFPPLLN